MDIYKSTELMVLNFSRESRYDSDGMGLVTAKIRNMFTCLARHLRFRTLLPPLY